MIQIEYIYWFAYYNEASPSVRYRGKYPLDFFEKNYGIKYSLIIPGYKPNKVLAFIKAYFSALLFCRKNAIIVIQRVHSNFIYSSLLKLLVLFRKKNTVYDLDDADYIYLKPHSIYYFARKCNFITAGSNAIAEHLSQYNKNIIIASSPTPDLGIVKQKRSNIFTIGWIGGFGGDHKRSLTEMVFPAIKELKLNIRLVLLGVTKDEDFKWIREYFIKNKNIQLEIPSIIDWKDEKSIQKKICSFDIGISTLLDNKIQRSKSGIKAKQYLNNGIPVLGSNLPENDWVIKDGFNGYFCSDTQQFKEKIREFYHMTEEQYSYFSKNARASVNMFDHEAYFKSFMNIGKIHKAG